MTNRIRTQQYLGELVYDLVFAALVFYQTEVEITGEANKHILQIQDMFVVKINEYMSNIDEKERMYCNGESQDETLGELVFETALKYARAFGSSPEEVDAIFGVRYEAVDIMNARNAQYLGEELHWKHQLGLCVRGVIHAEINSPHVETRAYERCKSEYIERINAIEQEIKENSDRIEGN